ncbi:response regulator [Bradyrhizobium sp.]|uniref:response regulator n=1 Tax=Bradyrhizobium sp. TaxID=376 RepID=UPI003C3791A7
MSRILIADDEAGVCSVVRLLLTREGHEVVCCGDGEAALNLLASREFDLALIDLSLPKVHGWKVIETVRKTKPELPIVVMSGMLLEPEEGLDDVEGSQMTLEGLHRLAKPFKPKDLTSLVTSVTGGQAGHAESPARRIAGGRPV